jgi:hypothetical protein
MDFDNILEEIGEFGKYQKIKYYLLCLPVFFGAANSLSYVFTAGNQHYRSALQNFEILSKQTSLKNYLGVWFQNVSNLKRQNLLKSGFRMQCLAK